MKKGIKGLLYARKADNLIVSQTPKTNDYKGVEKKNGWGADKKTGQETGPAGKKQDIEN